MHDGDQLVLHTDFDGDVARLRAVGELDIYTSPKLLSVIEQLCTRDLERIVVDGQDLSFVDSAGLRSLVMAHDRAETLGVGFEVGAASEPLAKVLEMTGLHDVLRA